MNEKSPRKLVSFLKKEALTTILMREELCGMHYNLDHA